MSVQAQILNWWRSLLLPQKTSIGKRDSQRNGPGAAIMGPLKIDSPSRVVVAQAMGIRARSASVTFSVSDSVVG